VEKLKGRKENLAPLKVIDLELRAKGALLVYATERRRRNIASNPPAPNKETNVVGSGVDETNCKLPAPPERTDPTPPTATIVATSGGSDWTVIWFDGGPS
jgi:hypothetical protein